MAAGRLSGRRELPGGAESGSTADRAARMTGDIRPIAAPTRRGGRGKHAAPTGASRNVGRIGALAVALGVGYGLMSLPVAAADTTGSEGSSGVGVGSSDRGPTTKVSTRPRRGDAVVPTTGSTANGETAGGETASGSGRGGSADAPASEPVDGATGDSATTPSGRSSTHVVGGNPAGQQAERGSSDLLDPADTAGSDLADTPTPIGPDTPPKGAIHRAGG